MAFQRVLFCHMWFSTEGAKNNSFPLVAGWGILLSWHYPGLRHVFVDTCYCITTSSYCICCPVGFLITSPSDALFIPNCISRSISGAMLYIILQICWYLYCFLSKLRAVGLEGVRDAGMGFIVVWSDDKTGGSSIYKDSKTGVGVDTNGEVILYWHW